MISDWAGRHWTENQKSAEFVAHNMCLRYRELHDALSSSSFSAELMIASLDLGMQNEWHSYSFIWNILDSILYHGKERNFPVVQHCVQKFNLLSHTEGEKHACNLLAKSFRCDKDSLSLWLINNYPEFRNMGYGDDGHLQKNDSEEPYVAFKDAICNSSLNVVKLLDGIDHDLFSITEKLTIATV